jgi:hypothetical protein
MQTMHTPREGEIPHVPQAQIPAPPRPGASAPGTPTGEQSRYATASERYGGGGMGGGTGASREGGPLGSLHISGSSTTYTILGLLLLLGGILVRFNRGATITATYLNSDPFGMHFVFNTYPFINSKT